MREPEILASTNVSSMRSSASRQTVLFFMTRKQRRLVLIGASLAVLMVAAGLVLNALRDSIVFFTSPADVAEKHIPPGKRFRLGGLVVPGSLQRGDNLQVKFVVSDGNATVPVSYQGILPDLFLAKGRASSPKALSSREVCSRLIPCSPSTTRPTCRSEVADALKKQGHWKDDYGKSASDKSASQMQPSVTQ